MYIHLIMYIVHVHVATNVEIKYNTIRGGFAGRNIYIISWYDLAYYSFCSWCSCFYYGFIINQIYDFCGDD
jgi:hypothetical protein